jgi:hypothetical protein
MSAASEDEDDVRTKISQSGLAPSAPDLVQEYKQS